MSDLQYKIDTYNDLCRPSGLMIFHQAKNKTILLALFKFKNRATICACTLGNKTSKMKDTSRNE